MNDLKDWWPVLAGIVAFALNWGILRGTIEAFRREIVELRLVLSAMPGIDKRLAVVETEVRSVIDRQLPSMVNETARNHESARAVHAQIRTEISSSVAELRHELAQNVVQSHRDIK